MVFCGASRQAAGGVVGFGIRLMPGVRLSGSSRGLRMGVGPRIARVHVGAGRTGFSSGLGPVSFYTSGGRRRRRGRSHRSHHGGGYRPSGPTRAQVAAAERAARQQAAAQAHRHLADLTRSLTTLHHNDFPPTVPPPDNPTPVADPAAINAALEQRELAGISRFDRTARRAARQRADAATPAAVTAENARLAAEHHIRRQQETAAYAALVANDPGAVLAALEEAFADNDSPAVAVGVDGPRVSLVVIVDGIDAVPERRADYTPTGAPRLAKMTKSERNDLYAGWLASTVLVTVKEAFAVCPSLTEAAVLAIRRDPTAATPDAAIAAVYAGLFTRTRLDGWNWHTIDPLEQLLYTPGAAFDRRGAARTISPIDIHNDADLAAVITAVRAALTTGTPTTTNLSTAHPALPLGQPAAAISPPAPGISSAPTTPAPAAIAPLTAGGITLTAGANTPLPHTTISIRAAAAKPGDFDLTAVLLDTTPRAVHEDALVFYNQPQLAGGTIRLQLDNHNRQQLIADLPHLPGDIASIAVALTLHQPGPAGFDTLGDITIAIDNTTDPSPIAHFRLRTRHHETALIAVELYRRTGAWKLRAVGQGYDGGLAALATDLGIAIND